jgi:succinoglycan biosynthesis protein ExoH
VNTIDRELRQRIAILRYFMIFGIVVLHTPPYVPLEQTGPQLFDFVKAFFQHGFFRASVPVLTFVSGYLLFKSQSDLDFSRLFQKKTKTILLPLILFNLPFVVLLYFIQSAGVINHDFAKQVYPFDLSIWIDGIVGLFSSPVNYPLNFLRDLYLISIAAPLFGSMIRHIPWLGFIGVVLVFWFNLDGDLVLRNTMPIVFYIGGLAAVSNWDMRRLDNLAWFLFLVFVVLCVATVQYEIANRNYLRVVSPLLIWPAASIVVNTPLGDWLSGLSKYSFITFLMHAPLLFITWIIYQNYLLGVPYWVYWIFIPIIIAAILAVLYERGWRAFPRAMSVALGGR